MKISQEVREYARDSNLEGSQEAVMKGMEQQAQKFRQTGAKIYKAI